MHKQTAKIVIAGLVFIGAVFLAASYFVEEREKDIVSGITLAIVEQEKVLSNIAEVTDRNGADAVVERIVTDCSARDRLRFDDLLGRLATVNATELDEVDNLFDKCAGFFSERKAVMVARMEREYEVYRDLVNLLETVGDPVTVAGFEVEQWGQLVQFEERRSEIFAERVQIQEEIINALQAGDKPNSKTIQDKMHEAKEISEEVFVVNQQSDALRATLLDL